MSKTLFDLAVTAGHLIDRGADIVYDVADESGQIVGNVKHMTWFRDAVALAYANEYPKVYGHLLDADGNFKNVGLVP